MYAFICTDVFKSITFARKQFNYRLLFILQEILYTHIKNLSHVLYSTNKLDYNVLQSNYLQILVCKAKEYSLIFFCGLGTVHKLCHAKMSIFQTLALSLLHSILTCCENRPVAQNFYTPSCYIYNLWTSPHRRIYIINERHLLQYSWSHCLQHIFYWRKIR